MKKITVVKKAQTGTQVASAIKLSTPTVKSDSVRAKEMSNYKQLRSMAVRGSTAAKESAPNAKSTQAEYKTARAIQKNGGKMKKCKGGCN